MPIGAYDPSKIHKITFTGKYHKTSTYNATHPSPQRTPVIFQAGGSPDGKRFAAKHAECVFINSATPKDIGAEVKEIRALAVEMGRQASDLKFYPSIAPILGRTVEEAQAKYERYEKMVDVEGGLAKLSGYLNIDFSKYPLDEPFDYDKIGLSEAAIQGVAATIKKKDAAPLTPRELGKRTAFCGVIPMPVGTPEMAADLIEEWINVGDIDGFNVSCKWTQMIL